MESRPEKIGPADAVASDGEPVPMRRPWGKIAAVVLVVILVLAAVALLVRRPNRSPTGVQVTSNPATPEASAQITFTADATDPDGDDLSYSWDFGDGSTGSGAQTVHAYGIPGKFLAFVSVTDGKGGVATNEADLLRLQVTPKASELTAPSCPLPPTCPMGRVVAVLDADRWTAEPDTPIAFEGNLSWADTFSWTDPANHSRGGTYAVDVAGQNASLFGQLRYVWGDGTANATGTSSLVGKTNHTFGALGSYFVRLTVTYTDHALNATKSATAGLTVRIVSPPSTVPYAGALWLPAPASLARRLGGAD